MTTILVTIAIAALIGALVGWLVSEKSTLAWYWCALIGLVAGAAIWALLFFLVVPLIAKPAVASPNPAPISESNPTLTSTGSTIILQCNGTTFTLTPPPAPYIGYKCDENGQPTYVSVSTPTGPAPVEAPNAPTQTSCIYNGDPILANGFTPANVFVLDETVNYAAKTVTSTYYFASTPVQAVINGQIHHNMWIYCTKDDAAKGANTEYNERLSESQQPGWAYGFTVSTPTEGTPSSVVPNTTTMTACVYNGDPIMPNGYTPTDVFVLDETVNYAQKTVTSTFYFTSVPVQATINGQIHHNLWIYCSRDGAAFGAQTEFAERSSEAKQPGWAYGFTVNPPFGQ